ncbi:MAG: transglycosylase domain-containing protein, partial [Pseudomonadota bacterium]
MPESMGFIQADAAQARPPPRLRLRSVVAVAVVGVAMVVASAVMVARMPAPRTDLPDVSTLVLDREGVLLRAFTVDEGRWRLPVALEGVDPTFIKLLVAYEDQGFFSHKGVDPRAVVRAGWQALRAGRVVSGASTLTMQTVRLITGARERTVLRKVRELVDALKLEQALSKDEILLRYLHLAPYGGNIEGVRAASLAYFGREPDLLTLAQAALLVALPQAPESRRPDRFPLAAERARARVLDQLVARGAISPSAAQRAKRESIPTGRRAVPRLAPHVARRLVSEHPERRIHTTTLRHGWQVALEELAARRVLHIGPRVSAAIVVMEQATGRLLASVGAARFLDPARAGHVDMTRAVRSPGSTLKPAIYGLGIDAGLVARGTLMEDAPQSFAGYEPDNFDDA